MRSARPLALAAAFGLLACSKPEPPTVRPVSGRFVGINTTGLELTASHDQVRLRDFPRRHRVEGDGVVRSLRLYAPSPGKEARRCKECQLHDGYFSSQGEVVPDGETTELAYQAGKVTGVV